MVEPTDTVPIEDLDSFVKHLVLWHTKQAATLKHFMTIPAGNEAEFDGKTMKLEGDALEGFKLGITTSLQYLGTLPFEAEVEGDEEPTAA